MKDGFDVHNYTRRMELATKKLKDSRKVSLHNRQKTLRFLECLEIRDVSLPRRIRYLQNLTKLAVTLDKKNFEDATRPDLEKIILDHGRLPLSSLLLLNYIFTV